jgi:hypothetical protein
MLAVDEKAEAQIAAKLTAAGFGAWLGCQGRAVRTAAVG